jgi:predicted  nucleic acid-binding Zn-ribbon protein
MPHQCTDCGRAFDDGSKEMLSGCPDCGGNKFQFHPDAAPDGPSPDADPPEPPQPGGEGSVAQKVGSAASTVRDFVGSSSSPQQPPEPASGGGDPSEPPAAPSPGQTAPTDAEVTSADAGTTAAEDAAQASARSELVSPDELPATADRPSSPGSTPFADGQSQAPPRPQDGQSPGPEPEREDRPDLSELRAELNDQFESIKVLEPGQYELNLMSLYDREEYIIALQEDGKYTIQVPERWDDD